MTDVCCWDKTEIYSCDRAVPCLKTIHLSHLNSRHLSCLRSSLSCLDSRHLSCLNNRHLSCLSRTDIPSFVREDICLVSTHNVEVSEVSTVPILKSQNLNCLNITMFMSQTVGLAFYRQKLAEVGPEWSLAPENRPP